jgi:CheY-like chemotaxis protein
MTDDLLCLQVLVVSPSGDDYDLFRRGASVSKTPIEIVVAGTAAAASAALPGTDLVLLDAALGGPVVSQVAAAARAAAKPPLTVLMAPATVASFPTDALAAKPSHPAEAKQLMEGATRVRLPSRVLVVDDSLTMRSIVRKMLAASRFPLEISEAGQGSEAIELARQVEYDIVFVDYNMPGFSGLETMGEFRREKRQPTFVLITSMHDEAVAARARELGAIFLKKPFFPADIEAMLCGLCSLRALNPNFARSA